MIRHGLITLFILLLCACGGSDNKLFGTAVNGAGTTTAQVQGTWTGNLSTSVTGGTTGTSSGTIDGAIVQGGFAFFFGKDGIIYLLPAFTGADTFSGTLIAFAPAGTTFPNGQSQESFSVTVTVSSSTTNGRSTTTITGNFSGTGETGTFTLTPVTPFAGNASIVAGNWQGFYLGSGSTAAVAITIQPGGTFTGNDSNGCALAGSISQLQAGQNLFTVSLTSTGSASTCQGQLKGTAFESTTDTSGLFGGTIGTYYYFGVANASGGFVAELKVQ